MTLDMNSTRTLLDYVGLTLKHGPFPKSTIDRIVITQTGDLRYDREQSMNTVRKELLKVGEDNYGEGLYVLQAYAGPLDILKNLRIKIKEHLF